MVGKDCGSRSRCITKLAYALLHARAGARMQPRVRIWPRKVERDVVSTPGCANIDRGVAVTKNSTEREYNVPEVAKDGAETDARTSSRYLVNRPRADSAKWTSLRTLKWHSRYPVSRFSATNIRFYDVCIGYACKLARRLEEVEV